MIPVSVARFRIVRKLGAGGMGEVYLADDPGLNRLVALKVLAEASTRDDVARQRLIREAQAAARLEHPNVCAVYEVGEDQGHVYFAMQYIEGETLAHRIASGPIAIDETLRIASDGSAQDLLADLRGLRSGSTPVASLSGQSPALRPVRRAAYVVAAVVMAAAGAWLWSTREAAPVAAGSIPVLAILPFATAPQDAQHVGEGISDDLAKMRLPAGN
jgi:hypothetical protein